MALQDLTPQLRTRLSRLERTVGLFVALATLLLLTGFAYYIYHTANQRGWFLTKARYFTYVNSASGLKVGDPVQMMGFEVGQITVVTAERPEDYFNVYVEFEIKEPYFGYLWTKGSVAKVTSDGLLGKRLLEVTKGTEGKSTYEATNVTNWFFGKRVNQSITGIWNEKTAKYTPYTNGAKYWLHADESPALSDRLEKLVNKAEEALPNILSLTNQLASTLNSSSAAMSNANNIIADIRPVASNIVMITERLKGQGALGDWLIPTNINKPLELTLISANATLTNANKAIVQLDKTLATADQTVGSAHILVTNANEQVALLVSNVNLSIVNLALITSNLNAQVQANTNMLSSISSAVVHADEMMQGLKKHWFLRSAFKEDKKDKDKEKPGDKGTGPSREPVMPKLRQQQGLR